MAFIPRITFLPNNSVLTKKLGIYLPDNVMSHGLLYVALSRSTDCRNVKVHEPVCNYKIKNITLKKDNF